MRVQPSDRQKAFAERARAFADDLVGPQAAGIDETNAFPRALIAEAGAIGLMGVTIPEAWGGAGEDDVAYVLALEAVARASATIAVILSVNNSLVAETILRHGTDAQRELWLRRLARGEAIGAFALSEEQAGSDAANQQTTATADGVGYRLRGTKVWVANAEAADVVIVFASTQPDQRSRGISAFLVPADAPGIGRRSRADSLGVRGLGTIRANRSRRFDAVIAAQLLKPLHLIAREQVLAAELPRDQADPGEVLDRLHLVIRAEHVGADLFPADQGHLGGLHHRIRRLDHGDESFGFDHAERLTHADLPVEPSQRLR